MVCDIMHSFYPLRPIDEYFASLFFSYIIENFRFSQVFKITKLRIFKNTVGGTSLWNHKNVLHRST